MDPFTRHVLGMLTPAVNLFDSRVMTATLVSATAWFCADQRFLLSARGRGWLAVCAPALLVAFVVHTKVHLELWPEQDWYNWPYQRHWMPEGQDYLAHYIYIAVALVLGWKAAWVPPLDLRVLGLVVFEAAVACLALELWLLHRRLYSGF